MKSTFTGYVVKNNKCYLSRNTADEYKMFWLKRLLLIYIHTTRSGLRCWENSIISSLNISPLAVYVQLKKALKHCF